MAKSPEYRAVSNFFRNTQKLTPGELKSVVREVVKEEVRDVVQRWLKTFEGQKLVVTAVNEQVQREGRASHGEIASLVLDALLNERLAQQGRGYRVPAVV